MTSWCYCYGYCWFRFETPWPPWVNSVLLHVGPEVFHNVSLMYDKCSSGICLMYNKCSSGICLMHKALRTWSGAFVHRVERSSPIMMTLMCHHCDVFLACRFCVSASILYRQQCPTSGAPSLISPTDLTSKFTANHSGSLPPRTTRAFPARAKTAFPARLRAASGWRIRPAAALCSAVPGTPTTGLRRRRPHGVAI